MTNSRSGSVVSTPTNTPRRNNTESPFDQGHYPSVCAFRAKYRVSNLANFGPASPEDKAMRIVAVFIAAAHAAMQPLAIQRWKPTQHRTQPPRTMRVGERFVRQQHSKIAQYLSAVSSLPLDRNEWLQPHMLRAVLVQILEAFPTSDDGVTNAAPHDWDGVWYSREEQECVIADALRGFFAVHP